MLLFVSDIQATLILIAKIINKDLEEKSCTIRYFSKYSSDKEVLSNTFKFDIKQPKPLCFWILKEYTHFHSDKSNKAYFQHIMQFFVNDNIELNVPVFTEKGVLELTKIKQTYLEVNEVTIPTFTWKRLIIEDCPDYNLLELSNSSNNNRSKGKEVLDFDLSRYCELELIRNVWVNLSTRDPLNKTLKAIERVFDSNFILKDVFCDDVGYIIYKVVLIAAKEGKLNFNSNKSGLVYDSNTNYYVNEVSESKQSLGASVLDNIGITIKIAASSASITNEVKKNCLIYDRKNCVECRVGDIVIFYFTKN